MAPDHQLSERVYHALKGDLLAGNLQTNRLSVHALEARYLTSATPVREALLRLVGEDLVDLRPSGGFEPLRLDQRQIGDLYELNLSIMLAAVAWQHSKEREFSVSGEGLIEPTIDELFVAIAMRTGNSALISLIDSMNNRMCSIRRAERALLGDTSRELLAITAHFQHGQRTELRRSIIAYHRRRLRQCTVIALRVSNAGSF